MYSTLKEKRSVSNPWTINTYTLKAEFKCHKTRKCQNEAKAKFCPEIRDVNVNVEEYLKSQLHCGIELCHPWKCQEC